MATKLDQIVASNKDETNKDEPCEPQSHEVCIITAGSVDSGKSSYLGVITHGELDDGSGSARAKVAKHPHEVSLGKTSDISVNYLRINENKELVLVDVCGHEKYLKTTIAATTSS